MTLWEPETEGCSSTLSLPPPCMIHLISDFTLGWLPLGLGVVVYSLHYCSAVCIRQLLGVHIVQKSGL